MIEKYSRHLSIIQIRKWQKLNQWIIILLLIFSFLSSCKKEEVKPQRIIVAEKVSAELKKKNLKRVQVYQWYADGYKSISGIIDFKVEDGYIVFDDKGGGVSYMSFDRLTTFRLFDTRAELYFGF